MGDIKQVLVTEELEPRMLSPKRICVELCENIHFHNRNVRYNFSQEEWATLAAAMQNLYKATEYSIDKNKYEEGTNDFFIQCNYNTPYPNSSSKYHSNRFQIEECRDDTFHIHYRDLRIELTRTEFYKIANAFSIATTKEFISFPYPDIKVPTLVKVPLRSIQPYDVSHMPGELDSKCLDSIEYVRGLINKKKRIRPITVRPDGQLIDGFKRFMAYKELEYNQIEVIVDPISPRIGVQSALSMEMEDGEYEYLNKIVELQKFDKETARENLLDFKAVLDELNIPFFLCLGTALGAIREGDFIDNDHDVDIACLHEDFIHRIPVIQQKLREKGFSVEGWSRPYKYQRTINATRNGVDVGLRDYALYEDLRFFADIRLFDELDICAVYPAWLFDDMETIKFQGEDFRIPSPKIFIKQTYGRYWKVPDPTKTGNEADVIGFWKGIDQCKIVKE